MFMMGNKLSGSCAPLIKKAYKYEDTLWQQQRHRDGHLLRLWAEVFHVSAASGAVRWQQISEDLVPVNITCIQDQPECVFHITAYNSQVEKILDVRLIQPGTRLGQASECFVYWKDTATGDTWGLNFTSPLDAKQFRECCSPAFKLARRTTPPYSLRLNEPKKRVAAGKEGKRKPQSTPSSPRRSGYGPEELQCTCMTAEVLHRQRNGRVRYQATTLPSRIIRQDSGGTQSSYGSGQVEVKSAQGAHQRVQQSQAINYRAATSGAQYARTQYAQSGRREQTRSLDSQIYEQRRRLEQQQAAAAKRVAEKSATTGTDKSKSRSTDDVRRTVATGTEDLQVEVHTLKRTHPLQRQSAEEAQAARTSTTGTNTPTTAAQPRSQIKIQRPTSVPSWSYTLNDRGRSQRSMEARRRSLERSACVDLTDHSPPPEHYLSDTVAKCYATTPTPSSSDDEGKSHLTHRKIQKAMSATENGRPASPSTNRILHDYEQHLRSVLAKDHEETYSFQTFEVLLSQSMENLFYLMREVQSELDAIRKEKRLIKRGAQSDGDVPTSSKPYWARSYILPSRGTSMPPSSGHSTSDLYSALRKSSAPIFDTMSMDAGLPFFRPQSSIESTDSKLYRTSSEVRRQFLNRASSY